MLFLHKKNIGHPMWRDRSTNELGRTLVNALHDSSRVLNVINVGQHTFVSTNGGSVIDHFIMSERITETTNFIMVDCEIELFTGAPTRGHLPVWLNMNGEDTKEVTNLKTSRTPNGKGFTSVLQTASEQHISVKKVCCFSNPY